jgi:hypothetical protein
LYEKKLHHCHIRVFPPYATGALTSEDHEQLRQPGMNPQRGTAWFGFTGLGVLISAALAAKLPVFPGGVTATAWTAGCHAMSLETSGVLGNSSSCAEAAVVSAAAGVLLIVAILLLVAAAGFVVASMRGSPTPGRHSSRQAPSRPGTGSPADGA